MSPGDTLIVYVRVAALDRLDMRRRGNAADLAAWLEGRGAKSARELR